MYTVRLIAAVFSVFCIMSVQSLAEVSEEATSFLFVQTAKGVKFEGDTMTLRGVAPSMVFFADRPDRAAGHVPTSHFVNMWSEGQDSFKEDPPNANLSILGDKEGATNIVVELMNPRMEGEDITYDIKVLDGNPPKEGGLSSLFIDWWVGPRGAVCYRNWYTGGRWCHFPGPYYRPYVRPY